MRPSADWFDARARTEEMEQEESSLEGLLSVSCVWDAQAAWNGPNIPSPTGPTGLPHTRVAAALPILMAGDV